MNFVSEEELKKQAEDGKVDEPVDYRPLYDRLKEVRDKAQAEKDEQFALKNQFRGLDSDETDFLEKINQLKDNMERKRKKEENELLKKALKADAEASSSALSIPSISLKPKMEKKSGVVTAAKIQKEALKKLVVKRKAPTEAESPEVKVQKVELPVATADNDSNKEAKVIEKKPVGLLQGYSSSEEED